MVSTIEVSPESVTKTQELKYLLSGQSEECMAQCPSCKAIETITLGFDGQLFTTRKFFQSGRRIYHKCGTDIPCRLFRSQ